LCVSSEVSFSLSGLLLLAGLYCVNRAVRCDRRLIALAAVPLIFSVQQFCEGWVWIGVGQSSGQLLRVAALLFLFFALFLWPVWIPLSLLTVETRKKLKVFLRVVILAGAIMGLALYLPILMNPDWLTIEVVKHSIHYNMDASPVMRIFSSALWEFVYLAIVVVPLFVSPVRRLFYFGIAIVLSAAVSHVFFRYASSSIWCFFAAALSMYLGILFYKMRAPATPAATI
jgi:hypothetical protein